MAKDKKRSTAKKVTKKPSSTREKTKYPGLKPHLNLRTRQDLLDIDYVGKLNDKEKAWLNSFLEEEVNAKFDHPGKKLNKSKKDKRRIYSNNNARNRCIFTRAKASFQLDPLLDSTMEEAIGGDLLDMTEKIEDFQDTLKGTNEGDNSSKKKN